MVLWIVILVIALCAIAALLFAKKKIGKKLFPVLVSIAGVVACVAVVFMFMGNQADSTTPTKHRIKAGETAEVNPLKGFFPFASDVDFPYSLEWFYLPVNAVEVDRGVYDWTSFEFRLNEIAGRGHQAVVRFYYDYPGEETGIPQYLIDDGLILRAYDEPDDLGGGGLCPDYTDENFRKSMQAFIAEFGKEYDGDPRIAFITEGLLGFWGEWHNWPFDIDIADQKPDWTIPAEAYVEVYEAFDAAFNTTRLLVREPKEGVDNAKYDTGYHDDSFAYATLSFENGGQEWSYMSKVKNLGMGNAWEYAPIGGEVYPPLQAEYFMEEYYNKKPNPETDPSQDMINRQDWMDCVEESHASFLVCDAINSYTDTTKENAIEAAKALGYDMQVTNAYYSNVLEAGSALSLKVDIKNNGVAPFYYGHELWPMLIGVKQNGTLVKQYYTEWDLCDIKADGKEYSFEHVVDVPELGGGEYTLCLMVQNPLYGGVVFSFANEGMNEDGWLELGNFKVEGEAVTYAPVESGVEPIEIVEPEPLVDGLNGQWQAENATLEGIAVISGLEKAAGGKMIEWVGSGTEGTGSITINNVTVEETGFYNVDVAYILGETSRFASFDANGGAEKGGDTATYKFSNTGGWSNVGTRSIVLFLNEGANTIKIYNDDGWAPDFDSITVTRGSVTGIQNIDGDLSDWGELEAIYADNTHSFWVNKDDAFLYFAFANTGGAADWKINLDTAGKGVNYVIASDGVYALNDSGELEKTVEPGADYRLLIGENSNVTEIMVRRDVFEPNKVSLGYELKCSVEFLNGEETAYSSNGGELLAYELKKNAKRVDVTRRFEGNALRNWKNTDCVYSDEFQHVWACEDEEYLYFAADYDETVATYSDWSVELNVDSSSNTGYVMDWLWYWESTGNEYKICADGLYRYTEGAQTELISDGSDGVMDYSYTEDGKLEVKVKKEALDMGFRKTLCYGIYFINEGDKWNKALVTNKGERMLSFQLGHVEEPHFSSENTLFDGWKDVDATEIAGKHTLWTYDDSEYLYMALEYEYDGVVSWQVMMDADDTANTGMQSAWPFSPGGVDYLIEGQADSACTKAVLSYQENADDTWTFGKQISDEIECVVDAENRKLEVKISKSLITNDERPLANTINYGVRFIGETTDAVGATNSSVFLEYDMKN